MTPDRAEQVHATRRHLERLAREHGWDVKTPHSDDDYVWLNLFRQTTGSDAARIGVEWSDELPSGCRMIVTTRGQTAHCNRPTRRTIARAITNPAWLVAAVALAADSPVIDLRDQVA